MNSIITYAKTELAPFDEKPFNDVDSLILSQISYMSFDELVCGIKGIRRTISLKELYKAEYFDKMFTGIANSADDRALFAALAASPRFRDIKLAFYENHRDIHREMQFCAVTFFVDNKFAYVAFRGTDETMLGWKEDFNMSYKAPIPSQIAAARYLDTIAIRTRLPLCVGGHSKGGNLAVYAASTCGDLARRRLMAVYSHDGPGFMPDFFEKSRYNQIERLVRKSIPQGSVVGLLLEDKENYIVVKSSVEGLMQHSPYTWTVENGNFVILDKITEHARFIDRTLDDWIKSLTPDEMGILIEAIYKILSDAKITPVDLASGRLIESIPAMVSGIRTLPPEARGNTVKLLTRLSGISIKNLSFVRKKSES